MKKLNTKQRIFLVDELIRCCSAMAKGFLTYGKPYQDSIKEVREIAEGYVLMIEENFIKK
jgi:hypothetical protein